MNNYNILNNILPLLQTGQNPNVIIQNMIAQNPQLGVIINQQKQSGMDWKSFVMQLARQNGMDITPVLQSFQQNGIRL